MDQIFKLASFVRPYWKRSILALLLLTALVFMDLAIPASGPADHRPGDRAARPAGRHRDRAPDARHLSS
ncbi:MAG: hypothetical protein M0C28_32865 [Candidatus Moduliflexus flocculans]|nr:hypothetical protein [Candidatus Moduliflexus flocculans]